MRQFSARIRSINSGTRATRIWKGKDYGKGESFEAWGEADWVSRFWETEKKVLKKFQKITVSKQSQIQNSRDEKRRMHAEKDLITKETTQPVPPPAAVVTHQPITKRYDPPISISPPPQRNNYSHVKVTVDSDTSPRQQAFIDDIVAKGGKLAVVTYDRGGQNTKELTVHKGEYLEVRYCSSRLLAGSTKFQIFRLSSTSATGGSARICIKESDTFHTQFCQWCHLSNNNMR